MASEQIGPRIAAIYEYQSAWLEPHLQKMGVSWNSFQLLLSVSAAKGQASQAEIAERLGVSPATLSESVAAHVARGWLVQTPSKTDRRVKALALTSQSEKVIKQARKLIDECEAWMTEGLSARELESCGKVLDRILSRFESS